MTATSEFFKEKKKDEIKAYFQEALDFIQQHQASKTIISAVVHMDEKTPHMHLSFVPLTEDGRLSAKGKAAGAVAGQSHAGKHLEKAYRCQDIPGLRGCCCRVGSHSEGSAGGIYAQNRERERNCL